MTELSESIDGYTPHVELHESRFGQYYDFGFPHASLLLVTASASGLPQWKDWLLPHQVYVQYVERLHEKGYRDFMVTPFFDRGPWVRIPTSQSRETERG